VDLPGTTWTFVEIDGRPVTGNASLTFPDGLSAVVETACRTTDTEYALETDSAGIAFGNIEPTPVTCNGEASKQDQDVADALVRSVEWRVVDSDHIELIGVREGMVARLARASDPD
jgi:heat shock protein HslJ